MQETQNKFYRTDTGEYRVLPDAGNTPYGYTPITKGEYVSGMKNFLNTGTFNSEVARANYNKFTQQLNDVINSGTPDTAYGYGNSGYVMVNGIPWQKSVYENQQANESAYNSGTMSRIDLGNGQYGYVPKDSPANGIANNFYSSLPSTEPQLIPPTTNLEYGATGDAVKQLQNWLIAQGYKIPSGATGFYGDETKAAVTALQSKLGVQAGTSAGIFGPATRNAIANAGNITGNGSINVAGMTGATQNPINVPNPPAQGTYNFSTAGTSAAGTGTDFESLLKSYIGSSTPPPSTADLYNTEYNSANISGLQGDITAKMAEVKSAQNELNVLNAELQGIIDEGKVEELKVADKSITEGRAQGQIAKISRDAAIKALAVQAKIMLAQAKIASAQGDAELAQQTLQMATDKLNMAFKLKSDDATNTYNYWKDIRDKVYDFATNEQKLLLDKQQKIDDRNFTLSQNNLNYAQTLATAAINNGQGALAQQIVALSSSDANFGTKLAILAGQIKPKATTATTPHTTGFADSKVESSVREDVVALLDQVDVGAMTIQKAYDKLRKLYSQSEVTDDALKSLLGILPVQQTTQNTDTTSSNKNTGPVTVIPSITNSSTPAVVSSGILSGNQNATNSIFSFLFSK